MTIKFYEASHRYKMDERWAPGVTTIINSAVPKNLVPWACQETGSKVYDLHESGALTPLLEQGRKPFEQWARNLAEETRDRAGLAGSVIHDLAQRIAAGESVEVESQHLAKVENAARFLDDWGIRPILTEYLIGNRTHWYCGTGDLLATDRAGRVLLIDYKSGKSVWGETSYQLEAYGRAEFVGTDESPVPARAELHVVVHLRDDDYDVLPLASGDDVWRAFLHMRALYDEKGRRNRTRSQLGYVGLPMLAPGVAA